MSWRPTILTLLILPGLIQADELRTLAGKTIVGNVTAISGKGITVKTDSGPVTTPLSQVLGLQIQEGKGVSADSYTDVRLLDDSVLHCVKVEFKGKDVSLGLSSGAVVTLPLTAVVSLLREAHDAELRKKGDGLAAGNVKQDRIVILKDGELNVLEGTFGEVSADGKTINFRRETGDVVPVALDRLHGMIFYRLEAAAENPLCRVVDIEGNSLTATKLYFDGKDFTLTTSFGTKLTLPPAKMARIDFNMGKLTYLSDMEPAKIVEKSGAGLINHYRKDVNLEGEPIVLEKPHAKGLSLHAYTELEYSLAGKYKSFKATLGVDTRSGGESQAQVTILCDGEKRFSEVITPKAVRELSINVKDVTNLRIIVSARNFLDLYDHVTLADARVSQ